MKNKNQPAADLDSARYTGWHYFVLIISGVAMLFDGFDYQAIAFAVPLIKHEWSLTPDALGALLSASFVGLCIGSVGASYIADRVGRKTALAACVFVYSIFTACAAVSPNYHTLVVFRCLTGLGLGGAIPITVAWLTEFLPKKNRAFVISVAVGFWATGLILASGTALLVIPTYGWRGFFVLGALPAILAIIMVLAAPESPIWLAKNGRIKAALAIAARINVRGETLQNLAKRGDEPSVNKSVSWASLFGAKMIRTTLIISVLYFCINGFTAGVMQWMPTMLITKGLSQHDSYQYSLVVSIGPICGIFIMGALLDKLGRRITFILFWLIGAFFTALFSFADGAIATMAFGCGLALFTVSTYACLDVITGELYPTEVRSSAVGWGMGMGRVGGIVGPIVGGLLLSHGISYSEFFLIFTIPLFINIFVSIGLRYVDPPRQARLTALVPVDNGS